LFNNLGTLKTIYRPGSYFGRTAFYCMFNVYSEQNLFTFYPLQEYSRRKKILSYAYLKSRILQDYITSVIKEKVYYYVKLIKRKVNSISNVFLSLYYYSLDNITYFIYSKSGATSALLSSEEDQALISNIIHPCCRKLLWC
jgi:hypothetical protein